MIGDVLRTILGSSEFAAGFRFGLVALAVGLAIAFARPATDPLPIAGLLFAAAFALAVGRALGLPAGLALGLIVLGGAGVVHGRRPIGPLALLLAVPGAWLVVSRSGLVVDWWAQLLVGAAIVLGGWLLADFDARWRRQGLGPALLTVSVAGIYVTVPDTEQALVALGAALPVALLGWPWPLASLGRAGAYAATGALLWVVAAGGGGRGSAVVGGVACLGLLAVEPLARLLDAGHESVLEWRSAGHRSAAAVLIHVGLVLVAARVAGLRSTVASAVTVALAELCAATLLAVAVTAARRARRHPGFP